MGIKKQRLSLFISVFMILCVTAHSQEFNERVSNVPLKLFNIQDNISVNLNITLIKTYPQTKQFEDKRIAAVLSLMFRF